MDVNEYLNLVPTENAYAPKFMRFLETILQPVMDLQSVATSYHSYDARSASGKQLDLIGDVIGVKRRLPYIPASGNPDMTDDEYSLAVQLRIAQESWDGRNETVSDIYRRIVGNIINIDYEDNLNCTMTINTDVAGQAIAQIFSSTSEFLVPAGVDVEIRVNDEPSEEEYYYGAAITGIEYELYLELGGIE